MAALRILVLDDSEQQVDLFKRTVSALGHDVVTATSQEEAQQELCARPFDLVIIDYHMPGMNGDEALLRLKSAPILGTPRYYIYTSDQTIGSLDLALGFDGAIVAKGDAELLKSQIVALAKMLALA